MNGRKEAVFPFLLLFLVVCFIYPTFLYKSVAYQSRADYDISSVRTPLKSRRSLLKNESAALDDETRTSSSKNCVRPAIDEFLDDFMTQYQRLHQGGVIVHFLIAIYMFGALAIVCDDYFVPSLEKISVNLHMSSNVAGATFMAAGSSAPELFTSVIGVFITKGDIGLGTIVGSAVFNLLFVTAMCALFAGSALVLSPWPMLRDSACYFFSIVALIVVTYDKEVQWYEALVLVVMYLLYVTLMYFNSNLEKWFKSCVGSNEEDTEISEAGRALLGENCSGSVEASDSRQEDAFVLNPDDDTFFSMPPGIISAILWILGLPLSCLFFVTIPDTRKEKWQRWYVLSFAMSVVWIALLTYVLVWMVSIIGYTLGIPDVIMGLTFLAAGTSVPDGISSLIVARQGDGDMAVANNIGSNVFDILLCLGLPWLLQTTAAKPGSTVSILSGSIVYTSVSLLATVFVTVILIVANRWYLNRYLGATFVLLYIAFISVATLFELNVFGKYNLPTC